MEKPLVILLNPLAINEALCAALQAEGIGIFAFSTRVKLSSNLPKNICMLDPNYFLYQDDLTMDFEQDCQHLRHLSQSYDLLATLACCELHFDYTEQLAYALSPYTSNDPATSGLRFNKFQMNSALKENKLNAIPQQLIRNKTIDLQGLTFPMVIKPTVESGASIGVKICDNLSAVKAHVDQLRTTTGVFGRKITSDILAQEKIEGTEFFVDVVSSQKQHCVAAIYRYHKELHDGLPIYRYLDYLPKTDPSWSVCYHFIHQVLQALHMDFGFSHTELMLTSEQQPYLIEINCRMSGLSGEINKMTLALSGQDQATLYTQLLKEKFNMDSLTEKFSTQQGRIVFIHSWGSREFKGINEKALQSLQSSQHHYRQVQAIGSQINTPKTLMDNVARVHLIDDNLDVILEDTALLQNMEITGDIFND